MKNLSCCLVTVGLLATAACTQTSPDTREADTKAIRELEANWTKDIGLKDANKWVGNYAEDATIMVSNMPAVVGKAKITDVIKTMVADPNFALSFEPKAVDVAKSGDMAYTQGGYSMTMTDPVSKNKVSDKGNYLTIYKKQADGSWKSVMDATISEMPPPPPPQEKKK